MSNAVTKAGKNAMIVAFQIASHQGAIKDLGTSLADFMLKEGRKADSVEQFNASLKKTEDWVRSEAGSAAIKDAGLKVEYRKDGVIKLPAAWTQAASDVRGCFKYGVDLNAKGKDNKPAIESLSAARKLKAHAREAQQAEETQPNTGKEQQACLNTLQRLVILTKDLSEAQAAALNHQLTELEKRMKAGSSTDAQSKAKFGNGKGNGESKSAAA